MTKFFNNNPHLVYVDLPSQDAELTRIRPYEEYEASGADADVLDVTPGIVNLAKAPDDVQERIKTTLSQRELLAGSSYPDPSAPSATPQSEADVPADDLEDKNLTELRKLARGEVTGFSDMSKDQLIKALRDHFASTSGDTSPADPGDGGGGTITSDKVPGKSSQPPAPKAPKAEPIPDPPPKVGAGSSRDDWAKFAKKIGVEFPEDAKRADLFKLVDKELAKPKKAA